MQHHQQTTEIAPWLVVVADEAWIYAQTVPLPEPFGGIGLLVYASTWLRCTDTTCRPVMDFLGDFAAEAIVRDTVVDPDMVHGKAKIVLYRLVSTSGHEGSITQEATPLNPVFSEVSISRLLDR